MLRSAQAILIRVLIQALIFSDGVIRPAVGISCTYTNNEGSCYLIDVAMYTNFEARKFTFPRAKEIIFYTPIIVRTGNELLNHLPNVVEKLQIYDGSVPELVIKNTLTEISVYRSLVRDVIIDGTDSYLLKELAIVYNQLGSVPENINKLTNLQKLHLHDNDIQTVNMDHFENMIRLELLALQNNKISRIDTSVSLRLPNLSKLYLESNQIESLSTKFWNFPTLQTIELQNNKLRKIESFWGHFPNLTETYFAQNQWSCAWLEQTLPFDIRSGFKVYGGETCSEKSVRAFCCYDSVEDVKNSLEKSMTAQFERIAAKLERAVQQIDEKISKLDNKLDRTNEELKSITARVNENRALIGDVQKTNSREVDNMQTAMERNIEIIKAEVNSVESKFSTEVSETQAVIEKERHQMEKRMGEMKTSMNNNVQTMIEETTANASVAKKQVESEFREVNARINETWTRIDGKITRLDSTLDSINEKVKMVNESVKENRALIEDDRKQLEKKIGEMKMDIDRYDREIKQQMKTTESAARKQVESEFREVNVRIDESWALLKDDRKKFEIIDEEQKQLEEIVVNLQTDMERSVQTNKEEIDLIKSSAKKQVYEHALLEEKVGALKKCF